MALLLTGTVLTAVVYFYASTRLSLENNVAKLQLPAVMDACFLSVKKELCKQLSLGDLPTSGKGQLSSYMYTTTGKCFHPTFVYTVQLEGEERKKVCEEASIRLVTVDVTVYLNRNTVEEQRKICLAVS